MEAAQILDKAGVARLLGVSPKTVTEWVSQRGQSRTGKPMPFHKLCGKNGKVFFIMDEVMSWLAGHDSEGNFSGTSFPTQGGAAA